MRFGNKTQYRGDNDIRMAHAVAKPIIRGPAGAVRLQDVENGHNLRPAAVDPDLGYFLVHPLFIEKAHGLVAKTRGQGRDFQRLVPGGSARGNRARSAGTRLSR